MVSLTPLDRKFNIRIILTIPGGENTSSVAVGSILMKHPDIIEAAVIGVPDERWGEIPMAFITTTPGSKVMGQDVITWARESSDMGRFLVPRLFRSYPKPVPERCRKRLFRSRRRRDESELPICKLPLMHDVIVE